MNIRDLQYLVAVAETRHFGRAAEACFVSQPTLSMQLKKLEDELGVQLIERQHKQVMLTDVGSDIVAKAQYILDQVKQIKIIADNATDPLAGNFRLGMIPTLGPYLLPLISQNIANQLPNLNLQIMENKTEIILRELRAGNLDAIILALPVDDDQLHTEPLFNESFLLAIPKSHALHKRRSIKMTDLQNESLLLLEEGHCLRDQALEACQFAGVQQNTGFRATSLESLREMVAANHGVTILPELAVPSSQHNPNIVIKKFMNPQPSREIAMLWRQSSARIVCCEKIAGICKNL